MNLQRFLVVAVLGSALAAPAFAGITGSVSPSFGSHNYRGVNADVSLDLGRHLYVEPMLSTYRDDFSSGPYYNAHLRVGYDFGPLSLGVVGGVVPKHQGYSQGSFGADATFSLSPAGTSRSRRMAGPSSQGNQTFGYGLAGVDIGASAVRVMHSDDYYASGTGDNSVQPGALRAKAYKLNETDLSAFAGAKFLLIELSAQVTKSVYDKKIDVAGVRPAPVLSLTNFGGIESGYPESSYNVKAKISMLPLVHPYASYTHTNFELGVPSSNAAEIGGVVGLNMLSVRASVGRYTQKGYSNRNYVAVGAALNF
ncbi:MAG: hypothetical protein KGM24_09960 [Elusimicrobia bacterium]|nr:hypothetical protein [Elusimicrobiota bacterium]